MGKKYALRLHKRATISSAGLYTLELDIVPQGKIYCLQRTSWEISKATSGGNTRARLYITGHGDRPDISEQDAPVADTLYWDADPVWLVPGESMALEIDQAQANTVVKMDAIGYWTDFSEGVS